MTLTYVGNRASKTRLAEFGYNDKEEQRFLEIAAKLKELGWCIDTSVENWAGCEVEDKNEFELLKSDWKRMRRATK